MRRELATAVAAAFVSLAGLTPSWADEAYVEALMVGRAAGSGNTVGPMAILPAEVERLNRSKVVPYVKRLTNCFASLILNDNLAYLHYKDRTLNEYAFTRASQCRMQILELLVTFDYSYGPDVGTKFLMGPYYEDLNRALGAKVQRPMEAAIARVDAQESERRREREAEAQRQEVEKGRSLDAMKLAVERAYQCGAEQAAHLMLTNEAADAVAAAAMTLCREQMDAVADAFSDRVAAGGRGGATPDEKQQEKVELEGKLAKRLAAEVMKARSDALAARRSQPADHDPPAGQREL